MKASYFRSLLNWKIGSLARKSDKGGKENKIKALSHKGKSSKRSKLENFAINCFKMKNQFTTFPP